MGVKKTLAWARGCEKAPGLPGSQVAFVQKRFHKDIFPNPVLMLNFCPAAEGVPGDLQSVTREVLFLVDRSGTMSSPDLDKVKVRHSHGARDASWVASPYQPSPVPAVTPGGFAGGPEEPPIEDAAQHRRLRHRRQATLPIQPPLQQCECCREKPPTSPSPSPTPPVAPRCGVRAGELGDRCEAGSPCGQETLRRACEHLGGLRADLGGTNLLAALGWALAQPLHHGYPRQLFLFTDTASGNTGRILRLVRRQASAVRYGTSTAAESQFSPCPLGCSH